MLFFFKTRTASAFGSPEIIHFNVGVRAATVTGHFVPETCSLRSRNDDDGPPPTTRLFGHLFFLNKERVYTGYVHPYTIYNILPLSLLFFEFFWQQWQQKIITYVSSVCLFGFTLSRGPTDVHFYFNIINKVTRKMAATDRERERDGKSWFWLPVFGWAVCSHRYPNRRLVAPVERRWPRAGCGRCAPR